MTVLLLLAALMDERGLERIVLDSGCTRQGDRMACEFPAPAGFSRKHVRLETACPSGVRLNGITVAPEEGSISLTPYLSSRGVNRLSVPMDCLPVVLMVTPKVFLSSLRAEPGSGRPLALIENTLENTVNVSVACRSEAESGGVWRKGSGTIAAGSRQELALDGPDASPGAFGGSVRLACVMEKSAESVEEGYTFRVVLNFQSHTKNGSPNIR
ncbi:hypothetical protein [uncultured Paludibaculum sp.]|uniref:hypothetical protein n=1 Tax=uncultured Paludibaculum sp. TaxID=1765020 RepID=UPI002AAAED4B|nr:hypothetical protein [uncultured Paludibaculum sp.]